MRNLDAGEIKTLAGIEVNKDAQTPKGWKKWIMPARKLYEKAEFTYLDVDEDEPGSLYMLKEISPKSEVEGTEQRKLLSMRENMT